MEDQFAAFVRQLQPNTGYMRLYQEIVMDGWRKKQGDSQTLQERRFRQGQPITRRTRRSWKVWEKGASSSSSNVFMLVHNS
jgi:hypothetical protein